MKSEKSKKKSKNSKITVSKKNVKKIIQTKPMHILDLFVFKMVLISFSIPFPTLISLLKFTTVSKKGKQTWVQRGFTALFLELCAQFPFFANKDLLRIVILFALFQLGTLCPNYVFLNKVLLGNPFFLKTLLSTVANKPLLSIVISCAVLALFLNMFDDFWRFRFFAFLPPFSIFCIFATTKNFTTLSNP